MTYESCSCDGDPASFYISEDRKARKQHKCYECRAVIEPGERYEHARGCWEGTISTFKTCVLCLEIRQWARISVPCFCFNHGDLLENIRDMVTEVRRDCPAGFVMEWGRRVVKIERRRFGEHWPRMFQRRRPPRSAAEISAEYR